jgi:cobalamin biosynthesis Mg chelatase CobN
MEAGTEAATETTRFCPMCAEPLRPRATFCHRCGKPFPEEDVVVYKTNDSAPETKEITAQNDEASAIHNATTLKKVFDDKPVKAEEISDTEPATDFTQTISDIEKPAEVIEKPAEVSETVPAKPPEQTKRVKRRVVQTTEYVWEENSSDPTWRLALATILVLVFLFLVLWFGRFIHF